MAAPRVDVEVFFNYRSPYCYLASKTMWALEDEHPARLVWRPLGGWEGRSPPARLQQKLLVVRQDVGRWARRLGIPFVPPGPTVDPTRAAAGSLLAVDRGVHRAYTIAVMHAAWGEGRDISDPEVLLAAAASAGLPRQELLAAIDDPARHRVLAANAAEATARGIFGVPTFAIGDQLFWGQDRIDFVAELVAELATVHLTGGERQC
jgi:2-hydroxychromene-2-carboxylate isomerase